MSSKARSAFDDNKKDIDELWSIHQEIAGKGPGRKYGVDVLNRAAVVFVTACWESFVEDLITEAFDFMLANAPSADKIPSKVRDRATKPIFDQKDSRKVWDIADAGWRTLLQNYQKATLASWLDHFNTPKKARVDTLYEDLIGLANVSSHWHWQNMTAENAAKKLDEYITMRGNIAHRTEHDETVYKTWGTDYLQHVERLVDITEKAVRDHVQSACGTAPW